MVLTRETNSLRLRDVLMIAVKCESAPLWAGQKRILATVCDSYKQPSEDLHAYTVLTLVFVQIT